MHKEHEQSMLRQNLIVILLRHISLMIIMVNVKHTNYVIKAKLTDVDFEVENMNKCPTIT